MRPLLLVAMTAVAAATTVAVGLSRGPSRAPMVLGIPAYGYPTHGTMWTALGRLGSGSVVVLNPASGPGEQVDPVYEKALVPLRKNGVLVYGYVDTDYGRRPAADVIADATKFKRMYPLDGIFLDQTPADADALGYLHGISDGLRANDLEIAFNPGQPVIDRRLLRLADHIVSFEGDLPTYRRTHFPEWRDDDDTSNQWHLVHGVESAADMKSVVERAEETGAGALFVTDRTMPNPWDDLPRYWREEVDLVDQH